MPELPEVEIVKQSLDKNIKFKKIKKVIVRNRNLRSKIPKNFEALLKNKNIEKISRFSKYIILHFDDDSFCIIHLGMSGTLHLVKNYKKKKFTNLSFYQSPILSNKHNHIEIKFQNFSIIYNDIKEEYYSKWGNYCSGGCAMTYEPSVPSPRTVID